MTVGPATRVRLRTGGAEVGVVLSVSGDYATVFWTAGHEEIVALADLEESQPSQAALLEPKALLAELTARRLQHPLTDQLLSYRASRTQLYPHQFAPVRKLLASPSRRLLIADEVGTGKTIEAGLIWAELDARRRGGLQSLLVVCPKSLVEKWREEMRSRFDAVLEVLDGPALKSALAQARRDGALQTRFSYAVAPLELLRTGNYMQQIDELDLAWELVVFDEAHHLRTPSSKSHALARLLGRRADALVLLTATPVQTSVEDLQNLYRILSVDLAEDGAVFAQELELDMKLNDVLALARGQSPGWRDKARSLLSEVAAARATEAGAIRAVERRLDELEGDDRGRLEAAEYVALRAELTALQAFAAHTTRTLRAHVDEDRPTRHAQTYPAPFTSAGRRLYDAALEAALDRARSRGVPPGFATQMPERQAASCAPAIALQWLSDDSVPEPLRRIAQEVIDEPDPKADAFLKALSSLFEEGHERVLVFSYFRATLQYLSDLLTAKGIAAEQMHGGTPARDQDCRRGERSRHAIVEAFRRGEIKVLLASEVASEGLDLQFCSALVNYDLPWNPMKVEQRIGRIDRIGQKSTKVTILNLSTPDTIEHRILERLYERLSIFERALGEMEVVLGEALEQFEADLFQKGLNAKQQAEALERISAQAVERRRQQEEMEASTGEILGRLSQIEAERAEFKMLERRFLAAEDLREFVVGTLRDRFGEGSVVVRDRVDEIHLAGLASDLRALARSLPRGGSQQRSTRELAARAQQGSSVLRARFDEQYVEGTELLHVRHPIVLLARHIANETLSPAAALGVGVLGPNAGLPPGWNLLGWAVESAKGLVPRIALREVCLGPGGEPIGLPDGLTATELLRQARPTNELPPGSVRALVETVGIRLREMSEEDLATHRDRNDLALQRARRAIERSSESRRRWLAGQFARADLEPKIERMYRGWETRLDRERDESLADLEQQGAFNPGTTFLGAALVLVA